MGNLREEVAALKAENTALRNENAALHKENRILRDDNERMKRILNNSSKNSSLPPSKDQPGRAANTYNGRKPTKKKQGGQKGHKGKYISKADAGKKTKEGVYLHQIKEIVS